MSEKIITLSGAATDVLYSLFFRGALHSGNLPSKSGAAELRELGFAETRHTATEYLKTSHFTFLTAEGQAFAIENLVNTRFGEPVHFATGGYISSPVDALCGIAGLPHYRISSDLAIQQKIADALDAALARHYEQFGNTTPEKTAVVFLADRWVAIEGSYTSDEMRDAVEYIRRKRKEKADEKAMAESSPFVIKGGEVFIKDAFIGNGIASANYSVKVGTNHGGKKYAAGMGVDVENGQKKVVFKADHFKVQKATGGIIENATATTATVKGVNNVSVDPQLSDWMQRAIVKAVRESDLFTSLQSSLNAQAASTAALQQAMPDVVNDAIRNALKPGGLLWRHVMG